MRTGETGHAHIGLDRTGDAERVDLDARDGGLIRRIDERALRLDAIADEDEVAARPGWEKPAGEERAAFEIRRGADFPHQGHGRGGIGEVALAPGMEEEPSLRADRDITDGGPGAECFADTGGRFVDALQSRLSLAAAVVEEKEHGLVPARHETGRRSDRENREEDEEHPGHEEKTATSRPHRMGRTRIEPDEQGEGRQDEQEGFGIQPVHSRISVDGVAVKEPALEEEHHRDHREEPEFQIAGETV